MKRFLNLIGCLFGKHWYQMSEIVVHGERDWRREVYVFTADHRCHYCGKHKTVQFEIPEERFYET